MGHRATTSERRFYQVANFLPKLRMSNGIQWRVGHRGHLGKDARQCRDDGRYQGDVAEEANQAHDDVGRPGDAEEGDDHQHAGGGLQLRLPPESLPLCAYRDLR